MFILTPNSNYKNRKKPKHPLGPGGCNVIIYIGTISVNINLTNGVEDNFLNENALHD